MARIAGRAGRLYVNLTSAGTAEPVAFLNKWGIDFSSDDIDVTAFGDTGKVAVAGLPAASGSYGGFYDDATVQLYSAATDGLARRFYLYPSNSVGSAGPYWMGTATFDASFESDVGGSVTVSGNFMAAGPIRKIG